MGLSLITKLKLLAQLNSTADAVEEGIKMKSSTKIVAAVIALITGVLQIPSIQAAVVAFLSGHPAWTVALTGVAGILALIHVPTATATDVSSSSSSQKLGAWALVSLLLLGSMATAGCNAQSVAQDIVNWTPTVQSTATTVGTVVAGLDPADAILIGVTVTGFNGAAGLLAAQAQTYLNNPSLSALQELQAQALAFQQNVSAALLQAVKISNPLSQQRVLGALQGLTTALTAILALISTVKGNTVSPAAITAMPATKVSQILPLIDRGEAIKQLAAHYHEADYIASVQFDQSVANLQALGL